MVARTVGVLLLTLVPLRNAQPAAISAADLLEAYAARRFDVVDATLSRVDNVGSLARDLQKTAALWVRAEPSAERARRFAASAVAVELAGRHLDARDTQRILIPWAAALLAKQVPDERERAWFLAANALIQRTYDPFFWPRFGRGLKDSWDFPGRAIARFPKEDRFHLARVIDLELASWRTVQIQQMQEQMKLPYIDRTSWRETLRELAGAFEKLLPRASIGADVHLRLGHTYLRLERFDEALPLLTRVEARTTDPFLIYLSRYLAGRARRATGDLPGAAGAFRSALDAVPHAQSAALALASLTLAGDDPADAYTLVHAAVARATNVNDPWRQYQEAEFRLWHSYVSALRQEVQ